MNILSLLKFFNKPKDSNKSLKSDHKDIIEDKMLLNNSKIQLKIKGKVFNNKNEENNKHKKKSFCSENIEYDYMPEYIYKLLINNNDNI